jgi:hypothetical protein
MDIGPCEAETFWTAFVRKLARRDLRGVKLVASDAMRTEVVSIFPNEDATHAVLQLSAFDIFVVALRVVVVALCDTF